MTAIPSSMLPLGTTAPDFTLFDTVSQQMVSLQTLAKNQPTVILFICNHCPFVIHIQRALVELANTFQKKGVSFIAISANDADNYPTDGPEQMQQVAAECNYPFPYLYDESQAVAKAYDAQCTPDIFLFGSDLSLVYRGQFDDSRPSNDIPISGDNLSAAIEAVLAGRAPSDIQKPSLGCSIKWK